VRGRVTQRHGHCHTKGRLGVIAVAAVLGNSAQRALVILRLAGLRGGVIEIQRFGSLRALVLAPREGGDGEGGTGGRGSR
jgi:Tfp pilus assembly PilM family ATPase